MAGNELATSELVTSPPNNITPEVAGSKEDSDSNELSDDLYYLSISYMIIGGVGVLGNAFVLVVIFNFTSMRKQLTNLFIINQSCVDLIVSVLMIATYASNFTSKYDMSVPGAELLCRLWVTQAPLWSAFMASTYNLLSLTVERYMKIVHPIAHRNSFTRRKALVAIAAVWIWGIFFNLVTIVPTTEIVYGGCWVMSIWPSDAWQRAVGLIILAVQFFIPVGIMAFSYTGMILVIRRRAQTTVAPAVTIATTQGSASGTAQAPTVQNKNLSRAQKNLMKTLMIVTACFIVCWSWNEFYFLLMNLGYPLGYDGWFYNFTVVMVYINSCVNPFIYSLKYEEFQKGAKKLVCRWKGKGRSVGGGASTNTAVTSA